MASTNAIVGIGELLLHSEAGRDRAGGLAGRMALHAARLRHRAVPVSRIGQDETGAQLLRTLRDFGLEVEHVQTDPDLPTGRLTVRTLAGRTTRVLDSRAAFDNLQWDYDLEDLAQQAEAVVYGLLARRNSQARTTIDRFLDLCRTSIRVLDMTNVGEEEAFDRPAAARAMEYAEGVFVSRKTLRMLSPGTMDPDDVVASLLLRRHGLSFIAMVLDDRRLRVIAQDESTTSESSVEEQTTDAALVGLLHGLLAGWDWNRSLAAATRYARFVADHDEDAPVPDNLFDAT